MLKSTLLSSGSADGRGWNEGRSAVVMVKLLFEELTNNSRGSQKSKSLVSDVVERGIGDGEEESDGQDEWSDRRSDCWRAAANGAGLMKTAANQFFFPLHFQATAKPISQHGDVNHLT